MSDVVGDVFACNVCIIKLIQGETREENAVETVLPWSAVCKLFLWYVRVKTPHDT